MNPSQVVAEVSCSRRTDCDVEVPPPPVVEQAEEEDVGVDDDKVDDDN